MKLPKYVYIHHDTGEILETEDKESCDGLTRAIQKGNTANVDMWELTSSFKYVLKDQCTADIEEIQRERDGPGGELEIYYEKWVCECIRCRLNREKTND